MKWIGLIAILILISAGGAFWYLRHPAAPSVVPAAFVLPPPPAQNVATTSAPGKQAAAPLPEFDLSQGAHVRTATRTDAGLGVRFAVPAAWKLDTSVTDATRYTSSDFHITVLPPDGGGLDAGSGIELDPAQEVDASVKDPQAYYEFQRTLADDCSNCLAIYRTTVAGSPAVIVFSKDQWKTEESALIQFVHDGKEYRFNYDAADMTAADKANLAAFLKSVEFVQ